MSTLRRIRPVLELEAASSEQLRARILAILFFVSGTMFLVLSATVPALYEGIFAGAYVRLWLAILLYAVAAYEFVLQLVIGIRIRRSKPVPSGLRFLNAVVEITVPSLGIIILSQSVHPLFALVSPFAALYFIFIMLSVLRLEFRLSVFTGAVAAAEYLLLAACLISAHGVEAGNPLFAAFGFYTARAVMLLVAGIAAGMIGRVLRTKVTNLIKTIEDWNQVIGLFGQQVSEPVAAELLREDGTGAGVVRDVTVMFVDIRDFTPLAESKTAEEVVAFLNTLFERLIAIVTAHGGVINQFLGDGFMTTFGAPVENDRHPHEAVLTAKEIEKAVRIMVEEGKIPPIRIGVGIHSGPAVTGNIGSAERKQYSITGSTVILASRIEQLNKRFSTSILISEETRRRIGAEEPVESVGAVELKGRSRPTEIFRVS